MTEKIVTSGNPLVTNCWNCLFSSLCINREEISCNNLKSKQYKKVVPSDFLCKQFYDRMVYMETENGVLENFNKFKVEE